MRRRPAQIALIGLAATLWIGGCKKEQRRLPERVPEVPVLKFEGPTEGWPPRPQDRTNVVNIPWKPLPGVLSETETARLRDTALKNTEVTNALGTRFALVVADPIDPEKGSTAQGPRAVRLTFYSYANNMALEVVMKSGEVDKLTKREGYQPPEGREEIRLATELALRDARLRASAKGLESTGLVTFPKEGRPGYGHRVLHINFTKAKADVPSFFALVDLTEQKVLQAGPVVPK